MKTKPLPDKLSDLIRVAVDDFSKVMADERYEVNLNTWHMKLKDRKCEVCVAGAVISRSLGASITDVLYPECFEAETRRKLHVIDAVRQGRIQFALMWLYQSRYCIPCFVSDRQPPKNPSDLPAWLSGVADELSAAGL